MISTLYISIQILILQHTQWGKFDMTQHKLNQLKTVQIHNGFTLTQKQATIIHNYIYVLVAYYGYDHYCYYYGH